jgi:threonine/homoserine/homoserine lactone efflux protein
MKIVFTGIQLGIVLAFLIGPVFFTILQTSLERGFQKGALVALGVSISDTLYVLLCYFGLVRYLNLTNPDVRMYMAYAGGCTLMVFGIYYLFIKSRRPLNREEHLSKERKKYRYILKGFIINGLSPLVLIFWLSTISIASLDFGYDKGIEFFLFFMAVLITVLVTDLLKAYLAHKLGTLITPRSIMITNVVLGIVMIVFGLRLILQSKTLVI